MISLRARLLRLLLRAYTYPARRAHRSLSRSVRPKSGRYRPPAGFSLREERCGGVRVEVLSPPAREGAPLLHFHGGGHTQPMNDMYRRIAERYARLTGGDVYSIDYEAGADKVYPTVHDDCFAAYRALAAQTDLSRAAAAGDSFGANLLLHCCLRARSEGRALPRALVLVSPFADLSASGDSYRENCRRDPLYALPRGQSFEKYERCIRRRTPYCGETDAREPLLSPAFADFAGFPPALIQCGSLETSASDADMLAERMQRAGVPVRRTRYAGMWHDFLYLFPSLPESRAAWREIAAFLKET